MKLFGIIVHWYCLTVAASLVADKIHESEMKHMDDPEKNKELFGKLKNVHAHWYVGAVRGLLGAVGNEIYRDLPPAFQQEMTACLSAIVDEDDIEAGAKCVSSGFDLEDKAKNGMQWIGGLGVAEEKQKNAVTHKNWRHQPKHPQWAFENYGNGEKLKHQQTGSFLQEKHAHNIDFGQDRNEVNVGFNAANNWPMEAMRPTAQGDKAIKPQMHVDVEIADRSGITKIIGYPARFAQGNSGAADEEVVPKKVAHDSIALMLEESAKQGNRPRQRTRVPLPMTQRFVANPDVQANNQNYQLNWEEEQRKVQHRQRALFRMNSVKRLLRSKPENPIAWQNQAAQPNHINHLDTIQKASDQFWQNVINEWKETENQRVNNGEKIMNSYSATKQNIADQSDTIFPNYQQNFVNHPRRLYTDNAFVRTNENSQMSHQQERSPNLQEQHQTSEPVNILEKLFGNNEQIASSGSSEIRSDGWPVRQRRNSYRIDDLDDHIDDIKVQYMKKMPPLPARHTFTVTESPLTKISKIMTGMVRGTPDVGRDVTSWKSSYKRLWQLKEQLKSWKETQSRTQNDQQRRLLDMVTGNFKASSTDIPDNSIPDANGFNGIGDIPLVNEVTDLVNFLTKHNMSKSVKFLSPRLAPLLPHDHKGAGGNLLSPSLLAFYSDNSSHNIAPLPEILGATGMSEQEKESFMEFVMEITGARDVVDKIFEHLDSSGGLGGLRQDILDANDRLTTVWDHFQSSYSDRQKDDIDKKGYAFLDRQQLDMFYGNDGFYNYTKPELDLDSYYRMSDEERRASLRATVKKLAGESPTEAAMRTWDRRLQQSVLTPNVGTATVLAPFTFGPSILSPAVLGPLVLSPNIFSPGILSPYLLSPPILSPSVGDPLILSPYVLGPNILSPSVLTPYVLSPYVLSPNILNPYVLSPLILSPYLLSPDILSPTVLSGTILSPYVLSPAILSESVLAASVLSPSVLSRK